MMSGVRSFLSMPQDFEFRRAVCSHGWFVLAPNRWEPQHATFHTVVPLDARRAVRVRIREAAGRVQITADSARREDAAAIRAAVCRMLRLNEDLSPFHE